jgi:exonuclease III
MRIATYNFLAGGSAKRAGHWKAVRKHIAPDVLLTQESKAPDARAFPHASSLWNQAAGRRWGSGMIATEVEVIPIVVNGFNGWITGGEIRNRTRPLRIFSVHVPAGERGYIRTTHEILDRFVDLGRDSELVIGGDFNVACGFRGPDEPVKMSNAEREVLNRIRDDLNLIPCWQTANPGRPLAQTLRWTGNRRAPYHCDGIFVPQSWSGRLRSCVVVSGRRWNRLSDHNPVVAEFETDNP